MKRGYIALRWSIAKLPVVHSRLFTVSLKLSGKLHRNHTNNTEDPDRSTTRADPAAQTTPSILMSSLLPSQMPNLWNSGVESADECIDHE